jgi:transposase
VAAGCPLNNGLLRLLSGEKPPPRVSDPRLAGGPENLSTSNIYSAVGFTIRATEDAAESLASPGGGRWSAKRKVSVILELLRGADLETTSRKYRVTAATLSQWRDRFLAGGEAGLKSRETNIDDEEKRRLKSVVATVSVDNELLREKIAHLENGRPLAFWKSRP